MGRTATAQGQSLVSVALPMNLKGVLSQSQISGGMSALLLVELKITPLNHPIKICFLLNRISVFLLLVVFVC